MKLVNMCLVLLVCLTIFALDAEPQLVTVVVPEKTKIKVVTQREISTSGKLRSRRVAFKVAKKLTLWDVAIFEEGDRAMGTVLKFKRPGNMGNPGEVVVRVDSVRTQDGRYVPVKGPVLAARGPSKKRMACCLLPLFGVGYFFKGGHAAIARGDTLTVMTRKRHFFKRD